jgi:biotin carboxylase
MAVREEPLLAVVYSPRSRPWSELVDAASGVCRLLWVIDSAEPGAAVVAGVLRKFGRVVDTANCTAQEVLQRVYAERPGGVASYFDSDLHRQAWLAEALELPASPSVRAAALLTDKLLQRDALDAAGVPVPRFSEVREPVDDAEVDRLCQALSFPMMLKPRDGTACRDISSVADADELRRLLYDLEHPGRMVLEERMADLPPGGSPYADRLSIDSIVSRGVVSHLGVTGLFSMMPPFRSSGGFFPADIQAEEIPELFKIASASIEALGCDFGCYRTEIKLTPEGLKIIEVNGRPTGLTPATVKLASGLSLLPLSMRQALGEHVVVDGPLVCERVAYRYYHEPPMTAGRVVSVDGLDQLRDMPGVLQIDVHKGAGDAVDWRNGSLDKVFQVTGAVTNHTELAEHYRAFSEDVVVTYEHRS